MLQEAIEGGDQFLMAALRAGRSNLAWLASGDPACARRQAELGMAPDSGIHLFSCLCLYARGTLQEEHGVSDSAHPAATAWAHDMGIKNPLELSALMIPGLVPAVS